MKCFAACERVFAVCALAWLAVGLLEQPVWSGSEPRTPQSVDPANWGGDHVGRPLPEFMTGDECLFCHRMDVGPTWKKNQHARTIRRVTSEPDIMAALRAVPSTRDLAGQVEFVLGSRRRIRFLKRGRKYGQLTLLSTAASPRPQAGSLRLINGEHPRWDAEKFGKSCAGCHASGLDSRTGSFAAVSLDCFTCHGEITLDHTRDSKKALLARQRKDPARVVVSICGQCHMRSGRSRSTGRHFANNFVAGDNLFRDLKVDWSTEQLATLEPGDRHVLQNIRDVVVQGRLELTCLSCHAVHAASTAKHRKLADGVICRNCHRADGSLTVLNHKKQHSRVCEY